MVNTRNKGFEYSCVVWRQNSSSSNQTWQTIPSTVILQKISIIVLHLSRATSSYPPLSNSCFFSFPFLGIVLRYPCNLLSNASSRDHSRDPFAAFFHGVKKEKKKTSSQRNHSTSKIVSNTSGTYSCILVEGRYFSFREILSFVSFSKSHISPSYLISSESPEWERLPVRLWLLTTELRFCDTVNQRRDDFFFLNLRGENM